MEKGQTLYRISRAYGVDERYLARLNGVDDPSRLEVGQLIYVPSAARVLALSANIPVSAPSIASSSSVPAPSPPKASETRPRSATPRSAPSVAKIASPPKTVASLPPAPPPPIRLPPSAPVGKTRSSAPIAVSPSISAKQKDRGKFDWPVRGRILKGFGNNGLQSCQGLEIAASAGTPIHSASAGTVTYSGAGIRGYGNLIILKHEDAFFTVYAFNQKNLVKAGARVARGEKIALSGAPPAGGEDALHFEIRRGKTAVNPIFYLP